MIDFTEMRARMVENQLRGRGIREERVLAAFAALPREAFVPDINRARAYDDAPLPIGEGQTISQPYIVAVMVEALALKGDERVLEIGSGSGYAAAVLSKVCGEVYAIERIAILAKASRNVLQRLGVCNVSVRHGDGAEGWLEEAPFDAILASAAATEIPDALKSQLAIGGRLIIPVGRNPLAQNLLLVTRTGDAGFAQEVIADVRFVPLIRDDE